MHSVLTQVYKYAMIQMGQQSHAVTSHKSVSEFNAKSVRRQKMISVIHIKCMIFCRNPYPESQVLHFGGDWIISVLRAQFYTHSRFITPQDEDIFENTNVLQGITKFSIIGYHILREVSQRVFFQINSNSKDDSKLEQDRSNARAIVLETHLFFCLFSYFYHETCFTKIKNIMEII